MECGLLGRKLGHSYSPQIHAMLGDYSYRLFEVEPEKLEGFLREGSFQGLNVTIPYKKAVIPFLAELSPTARKLGAVNTIVRRPDGSLIGHNTDYVGFRSMAQRSGLAFPGKKVLVLGSGGASNTVIAVLEELGAHPVCISRSGEDNYGNLSRHADASIIVNATPVGMYPAVEDTPLSLDGFPKLEGVLDVIYNPARTRLLLEAEEKGLVTENGLWMLVAQAKESAEWFTDSRIPEETVGKIYCALRGRMENLILIGMPGSGKTTVGQELARHLGKQFRDADTVLEETSGRGIADIIRTDGEAVFRGMETKTLAQLGKESGLVIATGGGCVTHAENYPLLHRNGVIFRLTRDTDKLPTQGRPLSQAGPLSEMRKRREPMYCRFADYTVDNNGSLDDTLTQIITAWEERI